MAMAAASDPRAAVHRVDPDTLCLSCLQIGDQSAGCPSCGFDTRASAASPLHLPPRTILHGQYLLGRVLGQGGFGITYLGWDLHLDMAVALKEFLPTEFASRASGQLSVTPYGDDGRENFSVALDAFEAEARTLARCYDLPGVVDVLNYFTENATGYIVMPYLKGRTMRDHLRARTTPLPFDETLTIMRPVLGALREVHRLGFVHRDISPDNIYICESGRVCLLDFGAARNAVRHRSKSLSVQFKVGYTPEEQYRRHGVQGPWTDVYAAAATCYRAMTGVTPQPSLDRLLKDQLRPPGALGATLPRASERALMRALAVRADDRYPTVDEFLQDLAPADRRAASDDDQAYREGGLRSRERLTTSSAGGAFVATGRWIASTSADVARLVRLWLDAALGRARLAGGSAGSAQHERAIREQLAALWPLTLVRASLRDPHLPAGDDHGPLDVYAREDTRDVAFDIVVQNNYAGIRSLSGTLGVVFVDPRGVPRGADASPSASPMGSSAVPPITADIAVENLVDRDTFSGRWGPPAGREFEPGTWRIELWWDGRKIGERGFVISA